MTETDTKIFELIEILIKGGQVKSIRSFVLNIDVLPQNVTKIKQGITHFTADHIKTISIMYNVNANWIFGLQDNVFNRVNPKNNYSIPKPCQN